MSAIKKVFELIRSDSYLSLMLILDVIYFLLHGFQFYDSGWNIQPLIRLIFSAIFLVVILTGKRKLTYWVWWLFGNVLAVQTTFQNYTAFIIIAVFTLLVPRMKIASFVLYALEIILIATLRDKTPIHVAIHVINCAVIYFALFYLLKPADKKKTLDLTLDEVLILDQLLQGKQQKEIEQFSQNTVTTKLKQARERNGIASTAELLNEYKSSH